MPSLHYTILALIFHSPAVFRDRRQKAKIGGKLVLTVTAMDDIRAAEQAEVSRQELYEDYVNYYLQLGTEVRPCRDACLLKKEAQYLQREPEPGGTFTVFPFYQDYRKLLSAFIKATKLLETLCVNLFLPRVMLAL